MSRNREGSGIVIPTKNKKIKNEGRRGGQRNGGLRASVCVGGGKGGLAVCGC